MPLPPPSDDKLQEALSKWREHGTKAAAAREMGVPVSTFKQWVDTAIEAQKRNHLEPMVAPPAGHVVRGVSTLVDETGAVRMQWVKTRESIDPDEIAERVRSVLKALPPIEPVAASDHHEADLLTVYPLADVHIGMMSWGKETGEDYDTDRAARRVRDWIGRAVDASPASAEAVILDVGDYIHADDQTNQTPRSKHVLDVDTRHFHTLDVAIAALTYSVDYALRKHDRVTVRILPGNHNPTSYLAVMFALSERYRLEPRVAVQKVPGEFWVHVFGRCLVAAHHGDKAKPERIIMFLADEHAEAWGKTRHRYLFTGHLHHHRSADIGGVTWEQLRAVTARDAHAVANAYSARAQLQAITLHREQGEVLRVKVGCAS